MKDLISASELASTVCSLAIDFSFAQRIMIAWAVKVDNVPLARVLQDWPIGRKRIACDGGKL